MVPGEDQRQDIELLKRELRVTKEKLDAARRKLQVVNQQNRASHEELERYRLLVESAQEYAIFSLDLDGRITSWNRGAERIFGYTEKEAIGLDGAVIFAAEEREAGIPDREMKMARTTGQASDERWHIRKGGVRFWASGVMEALRDTEGQMRGFVKVLRDNTERKAAEEAQRRFNRTLEERVAKRTQQVRRLASRLNVAEQEERRRISQVLHDDLQQLLYGVEMKLTNMIQGWESERSSSDLDDLKLARNWVQEGVSTTRRLAADLSPPVLSKENFVTALEWLTEQMKQLHDLDIRVKVQHDPQIPDENLRVLLFHAVRELLFNVSKHSGVSQAELIVAREENDLLIHVIDRGRGFNVEEVTSEREGSSGLGLLTVRERLELVGSEFAVDSEVGEGTHVKIRSKIW